MTLNVTIDTPEIMTQITPITKWWICSPSPAEMLRGCHHLRGVLEFACLRMYRTMVRVTKNVRMKATRQNTSGVRPCGMPRPSSIVARTVENLRRPACATPGIASDSPVATDSLVAK